MNYRDKTKVELKKELQKLRQEYDSLKTSYEKDITWHKRTEENLQESTMKLARSQKIGKLGSWEWNIVDNSLEWSDEMYLIWGVGKDFALSFESIEKMIHPDDREFNLKMIQEVLADTNNGEFEFRIICPDRTIKNIYQSIETSHAPSGQPLRMFGIMQDITGRKLAEEMLQASEEKHRTLIEQSIDGIVISDEYGNVSVWNKRMESITGIQQCETIGRPLWEIQLRLIPVEQKTPELLGQLRNYLKNLLESKMEWPGESREQTIIDANGTHKVVQDSTFIIKTNNIIYFGSIIRDISEGKRSEELLHESEEKFRTVADFTCDWEYWEGKDGQILYISPSCERISGYKPEEFLSDSLLLKKIIHPDDSKLFDDHFEKVHSPEYLQDTCEFDLRIIKKDNSTVNVGHLCRPVLNDKGNYHGRRISNRDITKRKQAEQELIKAKEEAEESEARFRNLMEGIEAIAVQGYGPDGNTQFWNKASEKLYGYTRQEAIGSNLLDLIIPSEMKDEVTKAIHEMAGSGEPIPSGELVLKHKNGSPVPVISSHAIVKVAGHAQELFCLDIDISKRRKAEEALRVNEDLLNASQRLSKTGGWTWSVETQSMYWTEETYRIHDITPGEIEPGSSEHIKLSSGCYRTEDRPVILSAFQRCLEEGQPYDLEFPFTSVKGRQLWIRTAAQPVIENGKTIRVIGNIIDITERKLAEIEIMKSKELLRDLNKSLESVRENERADVSREIHDQLGQSLTALKIDLMSLRAKMKTESTEGTVLGGMIKMVNTISRDVQRISSELRPLMLDDLGLSATLEWYCEEFAGRTGLKVELDIEAIQSDNIDKDLVLYRVAQESLTNIIRHANAGMVQVSLHAINDNIVLTIQDDGIGISQDKIDSYKSLGLLGMSERVKQYDGKLEIVAPDKNGTIIRASIPIN